jgi:hypothetical protein
MGETLYNSNTFNVPYLRLEEINLHSRVVYTCCAGKLGRHGGEK